jgi:ABC-2 type transport system permease protein
MSFLGGLGAAVRALLGDIGPLAPAVLGIVVYCFFYPLPYLPEAVRSIPVAVADADASPLSREITRNLDATREIVVVGVTRTVGEAVPQLQRGDIGGIVSIPADFQRDVMRGTPTGITVMANGGFIVLDGSLLGAAVGATAATVAPQIAARLARAGVPAATLERASRAGPAFVKQPLFNLVQGYESYVVAASMGLIVMQLLTISVATAIGTWCEKPAWPIAPDGRLRPAAFAGAVAGFALVVLFAVLFWIGFVFWYHDLPRAGNVGGAIAFAMLYALAIVAFGMGLGAWMAERERSLQFVAAASIALLFMSGFAYPAEMFTLPVHLASLVVPSTPGIRGFIALNQMGASLGEVMPEILHLAALCVAYLAFAAWMSARRIERPIAGAPPQPQAA